VAYPRHGELEPRVFLARPRDAREIAPVLEDAGVLDLLDQLLARVRVRLWRRLRRARLLALAAGLALLVGGPRRLLLLPACEVAEWLLRGVRLGRRRRLLRDLDDVAAERRCAGRRPGREQERAGDRDGVEREREGARRAHEAGARGREGQGLLGRGELEEEG